MAYAGDRYTPREWNRMNRQAVRYLKRMGAILPKDFKSTGVPMLHLVSACDKKVNLKDFKGCMVFAENTNINSGSLSPFPHEPVRITIVKTAPGKVGKLTVDSGSELSGTAIVCYERVAIGKNVLFGPNAIIMDCDGHSADRRDKVTSGKIAPVCIEDEAWIGFGALILKGVRIGHHAVVAAYSVVTKDVPPHAVVAGNPARVIKTFA